MPTITAIYRFTKYKIAVLKPVVVITRAVHVQSYILAYNSVS